MLTWWLFRTLKFSALGLFAVGTLGPLAAQCQERRMQLAQWLGSLSFALICLAGFGMMKSTNRHLGDTWIWLTLLLAWSCHHNALLYAQKEHPKAPVAGLIIGTFFASIGVMVMRFAGKAAFVAIVVIAVLLGIWLASQRPHQSTPMPPHKRQKAQLRWFTWIAHLEGASLLFMMGISMPLKAIWQIKLDGGQGWVGWTHGVCSMLYLQALLGARTVQSLSWSKMLLGLLASFVPFGTFFFIRSLSPQTEST